MWSHLCKRERERSLNSCPIPVIQIFHLTATSSWWIHFNLPQSHPSSHTSDWFLHDIFSCLIIFCYLFCILSINGLPCSLLDSRLLAVGNQFIAQSFSVSDSLRPHGLQQARLPCLSPSPRVCSNSSPLSQWCHPAISSSVAPFSSCPQSTDIDWICVYVYV